MTLQSPSVVAQIPKSWLGTSPNPKRLRLLIVNYEFPPVGGGAGRASFNIARELADRGHQVHVLTSRYGNEPSHEMIAGVSVYRVRSWRKGILNCGLRGAVSFLFFAFFRLRRLLAEQEYDLVHYFFSLPSGLLSLYSHGFKSIPYIVSLRGSDVPDYDKSNWKLKFFHFLLRPANVWICSHSSRVVALSSEHRRLAMQFSPGVPIDVIANGIDATRFHSAPHPKSTSAIKLICVSRLIDRKGISYLLRALATLPDCHLTLAGDGPKEPALRQLAKHLGLGHRVRFRGYVPNEELCREYQKADLFVLPTLAEAQGNVILEAMSCGLPVVATAVGGIPEMIEDGVNGYLVPPGDVPKLATAIAKLARDPEQRLAVREANLKKIAGKFSWPVNVDQYESVYCEAMATPASESVVGINS